jgi:hypothetical protein
MVRTEEIQAAKSTIEFTLPLIDDRRLEPRAKVSTSAELAATLPAFETNAVILSGTQVLWSCFSALSFVGLLLWAILKLWLSE